MAEKNKKKGKRACASSLLVKCSGTKGHFTAVPHEEVVKLSVHRSMRCRRRGYWIASNVAMYACI